MSKRESTSWSVEALCDKIYNEHITFVHVCQRGVVWEPNRKSLLIQTFCENLFVPPLFCNLNSGVFDGLDGKQRCYTTFTYLNDGFALSKTTPDTTLDDGQPYELAGKRFSELPTELQNRIKNYTIDVFYIEDMSDEQITETLFRLNNSKPMSSIELARIRACSLAKIQVLAEHGLFQFMKENSLNKYKDEEIIFKSWALIFTPDPSFDAKYLRYLIEQISIDDNEACQLIDYYDRMFEVCRWITENCGKSAKKIIAYIMKPIHFISVIPIVKLSIDNGVDVEDFSKCIVAFFPEVRDGTGKKIISSISDSYNSSSDARSTGRENVRARHEAITRHYNEYFNITVAETA